MLHRILALTLILATTAACGGAASSTKAASVDIRTFQYEPVALEVAVGTNVTWRNHDDVLHTATSGTTTRKDAIGNYDRNADRKFAGVMDAAGKSFAFTFTEAGEYPYFCDRHPSMTGKVVVR